MWRRRPQPPKSGRFLSTTAQTVLPRNEVSGFEEALPADHPPVGTDEQTSIAGAQREGKTKLESIRYIPNTLIEHWSGYADVPSPSQRKFANRFFEEHQPSLLFTAGSLHQVQFTSVPEVVFLGRSNVGKSTLLNALLGRRVAHVSAKPGRTKTLNAWATGGAVSGSSGPSWKLTILDMPGYGKGSRAEWGTAIQKYLAQRRELKRVFVLVNALHGLLPTDREMLEMLRQASIPHQIVLSKFDTWLLQRTGKKVQAKGVAKLLGGDRLADAESEMARLIESMRGDSKGDRRRGELSAMEDIIACSGDAHWLPGQPPEGGSTLGITALRWSILSAVGIRPTKLFKKEEDITFDVK